MTELGVLTWPEVSARSEATLVVVPVGSTEQHGPHLPLCTDTRVAEELSGRLARARPDVVVAPSLPYGASGEHAGFPGTLSIGHQALEVVLVELGRSADDFAGVVFVSGHGGNAAPLSAAVRCLQDEGRRVRGWAPRYTGGDAHAGLTETSVMLALDPASVLPDQAVAGDTTPLGDLMDGLRSRGVRAVSPNGVLGDPRGASEDMGAEILERWADDLVASLDGWP